MTIAPQKTCPATGLVYPFERPSALQPAPELRRVQRTDPVVEVSGPYGVRAWLVTRHEDVRTVLTDARFSRAAMAAHGDASNPLDVLARDAAGILLSTDSPEHDRLRSLVTRHLSARQIQALEPELERNAERLVTNLQAKAAASEAIEFNRDFAHPFALESVTRLVSGLLGIPEADRAWYCGTWVTLLSVCEPLPTPAERAALVQEVNAYFLRLAAERRTDPGQDLLSTALHDPAYTPQDVMGVVFNVLFGGYPSMVSALGSSLVAFLADEQLWTRVRTDPHGCAGDIEEVLRLNPSGERTLLRKAIDEVQLSGVVIRKGDIVIPGVGVANRDPAVFSQPDASRPDRGGTRHLSFGAGPHACIGMALARLELRVALAALSRGLPTLSLACPLGDLRRSHADMPVNPIESIPLCVGAAGRTGPSAPGPASRGVEGVRPAGS